jgi:micrococcal nuclease
MGAILGALVAIDGDTLDLDGKRYRLVGFDTPETYHARCAYEFELGKRATQRMQELLQGGDARLEPLGKDCRHNRECARLHVAGEDAADILVREGLAVRYNGRGKRRDWCG